MEPDAWLVRHTELLAASRPGARALDLACGAGRHALWLAELGYAVDAWDISDVGLDLLERELAKRSAATPLRVTQGQVDLETVSLSANVYDLILDAFFLERRLIGQMTTALRPGGLVVVRTLLHRGANEDRNPAYLLTPGELRATFAELEILREEENPSQGNVGMIARKRRMLSQR